MSFQVCVDASVALKLVFEEEESDTARALWTFWVNQNVTIIAPYHLSFETTSVIRNRVYLGKMSRESGQAAFVTMQNQHIQLLHPMQLAERAWAFAQQFNRPTVYDSFYLALSEFAGCELWTADRRLYSVVTHDLPWVKWLGNYRPSA